MLYTIIITLIVIISVLLTIVVLLQPGQGQGLSGGLAGGGIGGGGLGARRAADLLSKSTTVLATALLILSVLANFAIDRGQTNQSAVQQSGVQQPIDGNMNDPSQTPSAVPELPDNQDNSGSGSDSDSDN